MTYAETRQRVWNTATECLKRRVPTSITQHPSLMKPQDVNRAFEEWEAEDGHTGVAMSTTTNTRNELVVKFDPV